MTFEKSPLVTTKALAGDLIADHRARVALERRDAAERRRTALADQCSNLKTPEERIRLWEKLHELQLPRSATHRLVAIIAADTQLNPSDVRGEQRRRAPLQKPVPEGAGLSWNAGPVR
jgi:hypothetical protein